MANQTKQVQFDHFRPYYMQVNQHGTSVEHKYKLEALLKYVAEHPFTETQQRIQGDTHMFHVCAYHEDVHMWELQVLHLREKILPGIADDDGAYELIQLEENQYPAESTTMLYDDLNGLLYMQRNIYGTSIRAFEALLQLISPKGTRVALKPVCTNTRISKITDGKAYRKLILTADSEQLTEENDNTSLGKLLRSFGKYQGRIIQVHLGFGRKRTGSLNAKETVALIREAYDFCGTTNLVASVSDDEDTHFETIDLLDDKASFKIKVEYSRGNPITHSRLYRICLGEITEDSKNN